MNSIRFLLRNSVGASDGVLRDCRGAVAVMLAIALSAIVGFAGLGSEVAAWYYTKRAMQGAADAAAASAAAELSASTVSGLSATNTQLSNTGRSVAAALNFPNGTAGNTVAVNNPPASTTNLAACSFPFGAFNCYVEVIISQPQTALLSAVFMSTGPTITSRAVALANTTAADQGCVLALDRNSDVGLQTSGNPSLIFNSCALYVNSKLDPGAVSMNGSATINTAAAYIVGGLSGSGLTATDGILTGVNPIGDPYAGVSVSWPSPRPDASSNKNCNQKNYKATGGKTDTISGSGTTPYVFCGGLSIQGNSILSLCPGTYIVDQGTLNSGTINAPPSSGCGGASGGVTIILSNDNGGAPADVVINGNFDVNLQAPSSGSYSGIALFQDRFACASCKNKINGGSTSNITGAIYFPTNAVEYAGGASAGGAQCTQLIAYTITFKGNSTFNSNCNSAGTKTINFTNGTLVM